MTIVVFFFTIPNHYATTLGATTAAQPLTDRILYLENIQKLIKIR